MHVLYSLFHQCFFIICCHGYVLFVCNALLSSEKKHINAFLIICILHTSSILFDLFLHILPDISCDYGVIRISNGYDWISNALYFSLIQIVFLISSEDLTT